ncbi:hypothetical protein GCM10022402_03170 [Salinactinospora qingdaonensis]|uniref:Putative Flp pilus-assembly TadG-like N-terminal domain-containing protein n=1 Tax=Salinactinospora qingdaonensis TaxID=702744 RepID=A0ABP7F161_9ACTN
MLLLFSLTLSLLALVLLFLRIGDANTMRSRAQTAADAAAIAAVSVMKDEAAEGLYTGGYVMARWDPVTGERRAEEYAEANGAVLTDIRASDDSMGLYGHTVRVEVRGSACQAELADDGSQHWNDTACDDEGEAEHVGNAAAIATLELPEECNGWFVGETKSCDGVAINSLAAARSVIDVTLTDKEGEYLFNGTPYEEPSPSVSPPAEPSTSP